MKKEQNIKQKSTQPLHSDLSTVGKNSSGSKIATSQIPSPPKAPLSPYFTFYK